MRTSGARMRLQLSLEFVLYAALVSASTVSALSLFVYARGRLDARAGAAYLEELAALINANMAYGNSTFYAFVPEGFCASFAGGNLLRSANGTFALGGNVTVADSACEAQGGAARLGLARLFNGTYLLRGARQ